MLRWTLAGLVEAAKGFRRINSYRQLPMLAEAVRKHAVPESCRVVKRPNNEEKAFTKFHGGWDVPDAVVLTGGLANSELLTGWIKERVSFLAPVMTYPGEGEMEALAQGAWRVLSGEEQAKEYV